MARHASPRSRCTPKDCLRWAHLLLALVPMGTGALAQAPVAPSTPATGASSVHSPAVMLKMEGFTFTGSDAKGVRWSGTGVWIRPGVLATNAYFIERATGVSAVDEQGHSVPLDTLLAWDPTNDLALLGLRPRLRRRSRWPV